MTGAVLEVKVRAEHEHRQAESGPDRVGRAGGSHRAPSFTTTKVNTFTGLPRRLGLRRACVTPAAASDSDGQWRCSST